jgi:HD-like signal output (HDOD) protein/ActR/RegA family two-component response regulator
MAADRISILFVDDDPSILAALRRRLYSQPTWDTVFAPSAGAALAELSKRAFDAIATDLHMPGMDGAALLADVRKRWPATFRIVLSGTCESAAVLRTVRHAHYFLSKPFDLTTLHLALERVVRGRRTLGDTQLTAFAAGLSSLPSPPTVFQKIALALTDATLSVRDVGAMLSDDAALSARVLRMVNSGFYGAPHHVGTTGEAAVMLGLEILRSIVLAQSAFDGVSPQVAGAGGLDAVWQHSFAVARATRVIATMIGSDKATADTAYQAAILHEIGRLVLLLNGPDAYIRHWSGSALDRATAFADEARIFGGLHEDIGCYVLTLWGLPDAILRTVAMHRRPALQVPATRDAVCLLHLADNLVTSPPHLAPGLDSAYVAKVGLSATLPAMRSALADAAEDALVGGRS